MNESDKKENLALKKSNLWIVFIVLAVVTLVAVVIAVAVLLTQTNEEQSLEKPLSKYLTISTPEEVPIFNNTIVLYLNMDAKVERRRRMDAFLSNFCPRFARIQGVAVKDTQPFMGCSLAHVKALTSALISFPNEKQIIILEDDVDFKKSISESAKRLKGLEKWMETNEWDVILLEYCLSPKQPLHIGNITDEIGLYKPIESICTGAIMYRMGYVEKVLKMFLHALEIRVPIDHIYNHGIMTEDKWFVLHPPLMYQRWDIIPSDNKPPPRPEEVPPLRVDPYEIIGPIDEITFVHP